MFLKNNFSKITIQIYKIIKNKVLYLKIILKTHLKILKTFIL